MSARHPDWLCGPLLVAMMMSAAASARALPETVSGRIGSVTDGDTFRLETGERIRIADIDAPESQPGQAKCSAELALGRAASGRARAMLAGRAVTFVRVGKSYRRTVARVRIDRRNLADMLVEAGIAQRWLRGTPKPDWCR